MHTRHSNSRNSNVTDKESNKQEEIKRTQIRPRGKKNLTDLIRRNRIFSGPCYKDPQCQKSVAEMGQLKWMWEGVTETHDEAGIYLYRTSSPSRIQMRHSNLKQEMCQMQRGAAKDGVIKSVQGCGARKPARLPGRTRDIQASYFSSSRAPSAGMHICYGAGF